MGGDGTVSPVGEISEFGTQSGTLLIPIERGATSDLSSRRKLGGIVRQVRSQRPAILQLTLLFSFNLTEP